MSQTFRNIDYGRMLYEALRNYFSINSSNELSMLYKYMACFVQPLQAPFVDYDKERNEDWLVAQCKWTVGQLVNVLNSIFDPEQNRIYITQSKTSNISAPKFPYHTTLQGRKFGEVTPAQGRKFQDSQSTSLVVINIPASVNLSAITARIEQIRLQGKLYTIHVFP